jgi:hypothetical protein
MCLQLPYKLSNFRPRTTVGPSPQELRKDRGYAMEILEEHDVPHSSLTRSQPSVVYWERASLLDTGIRYNQYRCEIISVQVVKNGR